MTDLSREIRTASDRFADGFNCAGRALSFFARFVLLALRVLFLALAESCAAWERWIEHPHWPEVGREGVVEVKR